MNAATAPVSQTFDIAVRPGDGIDVDVTLEAVRVLQALKTGLDGVKPAFHEYSVGAGEYLKTVALVETCRSLNSSIQPTHQ